MIDYKKQSRIVEEAHNAISWLLISHVTEAGMRKDYRKALGKMEGALEMIKEVLGEEGK